MRHRATYVAPPQRPALQVHVSVCMDVAEITKALSAEQLAALMNGIAEVMAQSKEPEKREAGVT